MAYTQNIDPAIPAGTDDAKTADDQLRSLKRDIIERLESMFADANNDPLIFTALWMLDSGAVVRAGITPNSARNAIMLGNGDEISAAIDSRTSLLPAHIDNNNKIYFCNWDGNTAHMLIVHQGSLRYYANLVNIP